MFSDINELYYSCVLVKLLQLIIMTHGAALRPCTSTRSVLISDDERVDESVVSRLASSKNSSTLSILICST
jgi:hypothetical protein